MQGVGQENILIEFGKTRRCELLRYLLNAPALRYCDGQRIRLRVEQLINDVADRHT